MAILSAMVNAASCYNPDVIKMESPETFQSAAARLLSKTRTIAAAAYKASIGQPLVYPKPHLDYCSNFLHMMFSIPFKDYEPDPDVVAALQLILVLHADHEQNCSTSTVRMVASSGANLFASCASGVCALWGPLHGGANAAVIEMLQYIHDSGISVKDYVAKVKDKSSHIKLMGFGHRVYKNYDPRAKIIKQMADRVLNKLKIHDPMLDLARALEEAALGDDYFKEKKLYPNVDFYSGIIMRAIGIPVDMFTVMFAIGRMPGWIANWKEMWEGESRIYRPRQVYIGPTEREYVSVGQRKLVPIPGMSGAAATSGTCK
jgi:citrate synthase